MRRVSLLFHLALLAASFGLRAQQADTDSLRITPTNPATAPVLVDRIIAIVDEEPILLSELEREIESYRFEAESRGIEIDESPIEVRQRMLDRLVEVKLLVAQAKLDGVSIPDEDLERLVANDMQELIDRFGSRANLEAALMREGMTFDDLSSRQRELNRNKFYSSRMVDLHIRRGIDVGEQDVRAYFDEHRDEVPAQPDTVEISNILIVPQLSMERQQAVVTRLEEIQKALAGGMTFEDAARKFSEGPNAARGGDLGRVRRGDLFSPVLEEMAWTLPVGEIGQPIQTDRGVHVLQVVARDENEVQLRQILLRIELQQEEIDAAEQRAIEVARLAREGSDFGQLANSYSDDPGSRDRGGALGSFATDQLSPSFEQALDGMQVGDVAGPLRGDAGWFVLKLTGRREGARIGYEELRDRIRGLLIEMRTEEELQRFLAGLRDKFYIEIKA